MAFFNLTFGNTYPHIYKVMNEDYAAICKIVNRLHDLSTRKSFESNGSSAKRDVCLYLVEHLLVLTDTHFENEQGLMRNYGYPLVDQHTAEHAVLIGTIETLHIVLRDGIPLSAERVALLKEWLVRHVGLSDSALAIFLSNCNDKRSIKRRDLSTKGCCPISLALTLSDTISQETINSNRQHFECHEARKEERQRNYDYNHANRISYDEEKQYHDRIWYS